MEYKHIIVPLDGSELAESVLPHLESILSKSQVTQVELIQVVQPVELHHTPALPIDIKQEEAINKSSIREAETYLQKVKSRLDSSRMNVTTRVLTGNAGEVLSDYVKKSGADLLVMATHGRSGVSRWIWGSTADKLLRTCGSPIFLVRPPVCKPGN